MPDKLTERLKEIREREQKATLGPWTTDSLYHRSSSEVCLVLLDANGKRLADTLNADDVTIHQEADEDSVYYYVSGISPDAIEFAAHSREDIPFLLDTVERLLAARARMANVLNRCDTQLAIVINGTRRREMVPADWCDKSFSLRADIKAALGEGTEERDGAS